MNRVLATFAGLTGIGLIAFGFYAIAATTAVTDLTALTPQGVAGLNEARAIYAGSFWAMGALILLALARPRERHPVLLAVGVIFAGFVVARFVSIAMDGYDPVLAPAIASELVAALVLILASRTMARH